jgi:hypothetical protein
MAGMDKHLSFGNAARSLIALAAACAAGCAQQAPVYTWSHGASGEYLFAYDTRKCSETTASAAENAATDGGFVACMKSRGYFLVDPTTRAPVADGSEPVVVMAPGFTQAGR